MFAIVDPTEAARLLHKETVIVDAHVDTVMDLAAGRRRLGVRSAIGHVDLPRLREAGVKVQIFALFIEPQYKPHGALRRCLELLEVLLTEFEANSDDLRLVRSSRDLGAAVAEDRLAAILAIEGGEAIETSLELLRIYYRLGVRVVGLTWNERNLIADGAGVLHSPRGLSRFGRRVVAEMNRLGMVVDVSHLSEPSFWDVIATSTQPVIASHSNARAVCDHVRNLTDAQIRAIAVNGGVIGLNFFPPFITDEVATVEHLADHALHILDLVGPDHLGIGSDFDGIDSTPVGLDDVTCLPRLSAELLRRGCDEATLRKILGENFLRVFRQVFA